MDQSDEFIQEIAKRNSVVAELLSIEEQFKKDPELMRQYLESERAYRAYSEKENTESF